jgi:hypothetical protein
VEVVAVAEERVVVVADVVITAVVAEVAVVAVEMSDMRHVEGGNVVAVPTLLQAIPPLRHHLWLKIYTEVCF